MGESSKPSPRLSRASRPHARFGQLVSQGFSLIAAQKGWTMEKTEQHYAHDVLHVSRQTLRNWKLGRSKPRDPDLLRLFVIDAVVVGKTSHRWLRNLLHECGAAASTIAVLEAQLFPGLQAVDSEVEPPNLLHALPAASPFFSGRQNVIAELSALPAIAIPGNAAAHAIALVGMGGTGKTELAIWLANRLKSDYPAAQILVPLSAHGNAPLDAQQALVFCLSRFFPGQRAPADERERLDQYRGWFHDKRAIIILDDALDDETVAMLVPPAPSVCFITSRRRLGSVPQIGLGPLQRHESVQLLRLLCPHLSAEECGGLADMCGDLPLALRIAGGHLMRHPSLPCSEYIDEIQRDGMTAIESGLDDGKKKDQPGLLNLTFEASYRALNDSQKIGLQRLSIMPAAFDRLAGRALLDQLPAATLDVLVASNWIEYAEDVRRYKWHDLLLDFIQHHSGTQTAQIELAHRHHAAHFAAAIQVAEDHYQTGDASFNETLAFIDANWQHIIAGQAWTAGTTEHDATRHQLLAQYAASIRRGLNLRLGTQQQLEWCHAGLAAARRIGDRELEAAILVNTSKARRTLSEPQQALDCARAAVELARTLGNRRRECEALYWTATVLTDLGELRQAVEIHRESLAIGQATGDLRLQVQALVGWGAALHYLGEYAEEISLNERAVAALRQLGDLSSLSRALNNLGLGYEGVKDYANAERCFGESLDAARQTSDLLSEGNTLVNYAIILRQTGRLRQCIEFNLNAAVIFRKLGDRSGVGCAVGNTGNAYLDLNEAAKAIEFYREHLDIARETRHAYGEGSALGNLGRAHASLGHAAEARTFFERQMRIVQAIGDRDGEANAFEGLGNAAALENDFAQSIGFHEQALALFRANGDPVGESESLVSLAKRWAAQGDTGRSAGSMAEALQISRRIGDKLGEAEALYQMAHLAAQTGDLTAAVAQAEQALQAYQLTENAKRDEVRRQLEVWRKNLG